MSIKKYNMLLWMIMAVWAVQAMDVPPSGTKPDDANIIPITTPYKPKFAVRHPNITNAAKSAAVGGFVTAAGLGASKAAKGDIGREEVVASGILGTIAAIGNYLYNLLYPKPVSTIDSLLTDPLKLSKSHRSFVEIQQKKEGYSPKEDVGSVGSNEFQEIINKDPISLLIECQEGGKCPFDRILKTGYREQFEDHVVMGVINQINKKQPINYTSFGSGGGLQDMIILTKVLAKKPESSLNIHLIDHQNHIFVGVLDHFKMKREVDIQKPELDFSGDTFNEYVQIIKDKDEPKLTNEKLGANLITNFLWQQNRWRQFLTFLKKTFPKARFSLSIHESTESYLGYLDKYSLNYPNVVVAADIQDTTGDFFHGNFNYALLCQRSLEKNTDGFNAWLARIGDKLNNIVIISLFLVPSSGAQKEIFKRYKFDDEILDVVRLEGEVTLYSTIKYLKKD